MDSRSSASQNKRFPVGTLLRWDCPFRAVSASPLSRKESTRASSKTNFRGTANRIVAVRELIRPPEHADARNAQLRHVRIQRRSITARCMPQRFERARLQARRLFPSALALRSCFGPRNRRRQASSPSRRDPRIGRCGSRWGRRDGSGPPGSVVTRHAKRSRRNADDQRSAERAPPHGRHNPRRSARRKSDDPSPVDNGLPQRKRLSEGLD